jgi:predicted ATPase
MRELPSGTVTFLFTDVEGSTRLLQQWGERYAGVLAEHRRTLREVFVRHGGVEVDTQGDAFFVAFAKASDAIAAAAEGRGVVAAGPIRVRMGLHTGEPLVTAEGYVGIDVHRAARIAAAGHGGQILVSQSTRDLAGVDGLRDLGEHRLKDLTASERLYQLGVGDFPSLKSLNQTNLPVQPTPLVGRERELGEVKDLLTANQLVTLTGAGGSGKTRLALQLAADLVELYPDGVWFVSLAAVRDVELIEPTIAQVVGAAEDLHQFLRGRKALLLLDNLEQLLPAAAPVVAGLGAHVLATSRERLNLSGEQEYPVPPLPVGEAAELFVQRARQLKPSFEPDPHVEEIARRLDGLPLAVELAAARVKVLTAEQIAERLVHRLGLLTGGALDVPERQRTLRATIEWSYNLLEEDEQRLFARLAVFAGSFDLAGAESICDAELDTLASLVEKSLLRQTEEGRFFLLETIAEFALEKLETDHDLRQRHANYFMELVKATASSGPQPAAREAYEKLEPELANLRAASTWFLQRADASSALGLGGALVWFWFVRDHFRDAVHWLETAPLDDDSVALDVRARAGYFAGLISFFVLDEVSRAEPLYETSLELFLKLGDTQWTASALNRLGDCARRRGDLERALRLHSEALSRFRELGDEEGEANTLHCTGEVYRDLGNYDEGEHYLAQGASLYRASALVDHLRNVIHSLADLALDRGDHPGALRRYGEALELNIEVDGKREAALCIAGIGAVLAAVGRPELAARLWGFVEAQERELGFRMISFERERYERWMSMLREEVGDAQFEAACEEGSALTREAAVAAALAAVTSPAS